MAFQQISGTRLAHEQRGICFDFNVKAAQKQAEQHDIQLLEKVRLFRSWLGELISFHQYINETPQIKYLPQDFIVFIAQLNLDMIHLKEAVATVLKEFSTSDIRLTSFQSVESAEDKWLSIDLVVRDESNEVREKLSEIFESKLAGLEAFKTGKVSVGVTYDE